MALSGTYIETMLKTGDALAQKALATDNITEAMALMQSASMAVMHVFSTYTEIKGYDSVSIGVLRVIEDAIVKLFRKHPQLIEMLRERDPDFELNGLSDYLENDPVAMLRVISKDSFLVPEINAAKRGRERTPESFQSSGSSSLDRRMKRMRY